MCCTQVQLDEQRSEMTALERALQQRATEAEASLARLRAEEATLTADRTGADERLQRLEVDRALLQAQKERQMEVRVVNRPVALFSDDVERLLLDVCSHVCVCGTHGMLTSFQQHAIKR